jgi:hypothetical protein
MARETERGKSSALRIVCVNESNEEAKGEAVVQETDLGTVPSAALRGSRRHARDTRDWRPRRKVLSSSSSEGFS